MKRNRNDLIAEIKTARDEAKVKANAYRNLTAKEYDYWRAVSARIAYEDALDMFEQATEHDIPGMAVEAVAGFEWVRDSEVSEVVLALADGRRDALATVAEWMNNR